MSNELLYEAALEAVKALFADQSVTPEEAADNLEALKDEIDLMMQSLN